MNLKWFLHPSALNVIMLPPGDSDMQQSVRTNALRVLLVKESYSTPQKKCFFREEAAEECTVKDSASAQKQQNIKRKIYTKEYRAESYSNNKELVCVCAHAHIYMCMTAFENFLLPFDSVRNKALCY